MCSSFCACVPILFHPLILKYQLHEQKKLLSGDTNHSAAKYTEPICVSAALHDQNKRKNLGRYSYSDKLNGKRKEVQSRLSAYVYRITNMLIGLCVSANIYKQCS